MYSVCMNDGMSEQINKQINERKDVNKHFALLYHIHRSRSIIEIHILHILNAVEQTKQSLGKVPLIFRSYVEIPC